MTKEQKKAKRALRHEVYAQAKRLAVTRMGLYSTGPQLRQAARTITERGRALMKHVNLAPPVETYLKSPGR